MERKILVATTNIGKIAELKAMLGLDAQWLDLSYYPEIEEIEEDGQTFIENACKKATEIMNGLKNDFMCFYEEKDTIGKRYRRHDAIGTPFCVTVDHQTLEDNTVTIRERDSMKQERVKITEISTIVSERLLQKQ